jgi:hypothetical protein
MRAARFTSLLVVSLAVFAACDKNSPLTPLSAAWLEWSDSVVAGAPFGVRVKGIGSVSDVRIQVRVQRDTIVIEPYTVAQPCRAYCPPVAFVVYDTLVWVPGIAATSARTVTLRASSDFHAVTGPPWPLRTFGTLIVSPTAPVQPLMRSVGVGSGFRDALGCYFVIPGTPFRRYISADQTPDWAPGFTGFVYGRVDPVLRSTCLDDALVIQVDSIK